MTTGSFTQLGRIAKQQSLQLACLKNEEKNKILDHIKSNIHKRSSEIIQANLEDLKTAQKLVDSGELSQSLFNRLVLNAEKVNQLEVYLEQVSRLEDPNKNVQSCVELYDNLILRKESCPIGVISVIFESRPEVVIQVSSLALKSGNAVILKGGREAANSNRLLFSIIESSLDYFDLKGAVQLIKIREDVHSLLKQEKYIDLIIPRGSNQFVKYIQDNSNIPVLGHAAGICHIFADLEIDESKATDIILDSKLDYPSACNAVETLLLHQAHEKGFAPDIMKALSDNNVKIHGEETVIKLGQSIGVKVSKIINWEHEYSDLCLSIGFVNSTEDAVEHINEYSSHHTDTIITNQAEHAVYFLNFVDSASVFQNASTRFSDGFVYGLGAEVGISTNKIHARGPVGLDGLMTYKYKLVGDGHIKARFRGDSALHFTHKFKNK